MADNKPQTVDKRILLALQNAKINFFASVPCGLLAGIIGEISDSSEMSPGAGTMHIPVTREEEGVAICAGAYLGGARPCLLMQNSGLGNTINALASLTGFYGLGLFLLIGFRGRKIEEKIGAQIPMGEITPKLLSLMQVKYKIIERPEEIFLVESLAKEAYTSHTISAALMVPGLWS